MKLITRHIILILMGLVLFASCQDDPIYREEEIGSGVASISATVTYMPFEAALETSRSAGNAIRDINSLSVIIYNQDKSLFKLYNTSDLLDINRNLTTSSQPDDYVGDKAESSTGRATFRIPDIPKGKYYIYAVANMGDLTQAQVETPELLKKINLTWNSDNISANGQMFGYFTPTGVGNQTANNYEAPLLTVNSATVQFHAWIKRAASKVTVVFDASKLHDDIFIYIHKVTIKDIPRNCYLAADNKPGKDEQSALIEGESLYYDAGSNVLNEDKYPNIGDFKSWMKIGRGSGLHGAVSKDADGNVKAHPETAQALYFYENLQGNYPNDSKYDKRQDESKVGANITEPDQEDYKDNVPYGTYIEVEGYYDSMRQPISSGKIKYRFMLGQDEKFDYDAFRNNHYKVTLGFKGYANQPDWHIEYYEEAPQMYLPATYFCSYMYNHKTEFPVRVVGNCVKLEAEIVQNDWHPFDSTEVAGVPPASIPGEGVEDFKWARDVWENAGNYNKTSGGYTYGRHKVTYDKGEDYELNLNITPVWAGFLSMTVPSEYETETKEIPTGLFNEIPNFYSYKGSMSALQNYFYAEEVSTESGKVDGSDDGITPVKGGFGDEINDIPQNKRVLINELNDGTTKILRPTETEGYKSIGNGRNSYSMTREGDGSVTLTVPMWTRPKALIRISGFSGNNPYETYLRKAMIRFRATFQKRDGSLSYVVKDMPVYQVRRVVNPKGVWRANDDTSPFHVKLVQRISAGANTFSTIPSNGSWQAYVSIGDKDFINLSGGDHMIGDTIVGLTDSPVDFTINFNKVIGQNESKCAVVEIKYHGLNCSHTVFVRQGYDEPLDVVGDGKAYWSSYSVFAAKAAYGLSYTATNIADVELTKNPLALGTFFKRGNYNQGLLVKNNASYHVLEPIGADGRANLKLATYGEGNDKGSTKSAKWHEILGRPYTTQGQSTIVGATTVNGAFAWAKMRANVNGTNRIYEVPTYEQFWALKEMEFGLGVLYTDGATETAMDIETAFGYLDSDNEQLEDARGMRGIIVYNPNTAAQVFFPVGYRGVGRRTITGYNQSTNKMYGTLRYGGVADVLSVANGNWNQYRPICYNIPNSPGAIYWIRKATSNNMLAWDINYFDLSFNAYDYAVAFAKRNNMNINGVSTADDYGGNGDALPIKLVYVGVE